MLGLSDRVRVVERRRSARAGAGSLAEPLQDGRDLGVRVRAGRFTLLLLDECEERLEAVVQVLLLDELGRTARFALG